MLELDRGELGAVGAGKSSFALDKDSSGDFEVGRVNPPLSDALAPAIAAMSTSDRPDVPDSSLFVFKLDSSCFKVRCNASFQTASISTSDRVQSCL